MTNREYIMLKAKLAVAKDIAKDFRENTSISTVIGEYEARLKHIESRKEDEV